MEGILSVCYQASLGWAKSETSLKLLAGMGIASTSATPFLIWKASIYTDPRPHTERDVSVHHEEHCHGVAK